MKAMSWLASLASAACLCVAVLVAGGCSEPGPELAPVRGLVTLDGKPLTLGNVIFTPDPSGPYASGEIGEDGTYTLTTFEPGDGAVLGKHKIIVNAVDASDPNVPPVAVIPYHYLDHEASGLTAEVVAGQDNVVDLELESQPEESR